MKKLKLKRETIAVLSSRELQLAAGGVIDQGSGDAHCPTTVGYPSCDGCGTTGSPGSGWCSMLSGCNPSVDGPQSCACP